MQLANPYFLLLLLLLLPYIVWYILRQHKAEASLKVSSALSFKDIPRSYKEYLIHVPFILRLVAMSMIVIVLCRPQRTNVLEDKDIEGIDIMLCLDISTSMMAKDLEPNRIEAAKQVAADFIKGRPNDNIGLTIFAGEAYTQCPMTVDHVMLLSMLEDVSCNMVYQGLMHDGTAIGMGVATAVNRLKDSKAKSKVIILLTDGTNNVSDIPPPTAASIAKEYGIRIYTIGVGRNGLAPYPVLVAGHFEDIQVSVEIDEKTLRTMASTTQGEYYRATDNSSLQEVYQKIDKLEKTKMHVTQYAKHYEAYALFAFIAIACLLLELLLKETVLKKLP